MTENIFQSRAVSVQCELSEELCKAIKDACYQYSDRITLATAIGCLRIAEIELIQEAE